MKYEVKIHVEGWATLIVEADSEEQAKELAGQRFDDGDDGLLEVNASDSHRDRVKVVP